ncbi:ABC transporter permease [Ramlibacter sp.]|uniref:ABC transporter permease n=1 Tax=Ramlibacter sp. TaxID=1917967 RepID=UPI003D11014A
MNAVSRIFQPDGRNLSSGGFALLVAPFFTLMLLVFLYPMLSLLSASVLEPEPTVAHYERALTDPVFVGILLRTLQIGFTVAVASLLMAYPVALLMARSSGPKSILITACIVLPMWSSVLVRTTAWAVLLQRNGLVNEALQFLHLTDGPLKLLYTRTAVVLAMTHVLLPLMVLPIYGSLRSIPVNYDRAAEIMGASPLRRFLEVTLPLSMPGVLTGFLMVFLISLGYFITPALLGSPQEMMVSTLISQQITMLLDWPFGAALVGVLTLFVLFVVLAFGKFARFDKLMGGAV